MKQANYSTLCVLDLKRQNNRFYNTLPGYLHLEGERPLRQYLKTFFDSKVCCCQPKKRDVPVPPPHSVHPHLGVKMSEDARKN